jgi:hypothetical protein
MRRHEPDPVAAVAALGRRLDGIDTRLNRVDQLAEDVSALGRGLADLTAQLRGLSQAAGRRVVAAPLQPPAATAGGGTDIDSVGSAPALDAAEQPNWLTVSDPDVAGHWLAEAVSFSEDVLARLGLRLAPACWLLHPRTVVEVIALRAQYIQAYAAGVTDVSELLSRWLPGTAARISKDLSSCDAQRAHQCRGRAWEIPHLDPMRVAAWWIDTRGLGVDEVEAFGMTRIP